VAGYLLRKMDFPLPPILLGVVLGDMMEAALRQSLALSKGSWMIFIQRPVAASLLLVFLIVATWQLYTIFRHGKVGWESDDA
jgi:putative tricarboxylic transport membrane protein